MACSTSKPEYGMVGDVELEDGIKLSDLYNLKDITFSVKNPMNLDEDDAFKQPEDIFDADTLIQNVNLDAVDSSNVQETPFESIRARMKNITPDGTVMKRVLREGIGEVISKDAVVRIHYDGFFEFNEVPFDSTTLRGKSFEFALGSGFIPGLDLGVATMKKREKSEFMLQPSVAWGKVGCPPRIPANCEVFFIVEVVSWSAGSEAAVTRALANEGRVSFDLCRETFKGLVKEGIDHYKKDYFRESKAKLDKAKRLITDCHTKDEAEDAERNKLVFKVCLNLAMVCNKLPGKSSAPNAILNCKKAVDYDPTNGKAHLQWGIALTTLGEYSKAREHLLKAKRRLNESDAMVVEALERLEEKKKLESEGGKAFWSKALNLSSQPIEAENKMPPEAKQILHQLEEFSKDPEKKILVLPSGITHIEKEVILSSQERLNLNVVQRENSISITKY